MDGPAADFHALRAMPDGDAIEIVDQTRLPHRWVIVRVTTVAEAAHAIRSMQVRGAPLIGATAAYGLALALRADPSDANLHAARTQLLATRPTAVNLRWALDRCVSAVTSLPLQRGGVGHTRAGHGDGTHLSRPRSGDSSACLGQ
jgi:methylthioribose-1-phosphate isomerase